MKDKKKLTTKQKGVLQYIKTTLCTRGYSPTIREIADYFDFSVKAAYDYVAVLQNKGYIKTTKGMARSITVTHNTLNSDKDNKYAIVSCDCFERTHMHTKIFVERVHEIEEPHLYIPQPADPYYLNADYDINEIKTKEPVYYQINACPFCRKDIVFKNTEEQTDKKEKN